MINQGGVIVLTVRLLVICADVLPDITLRLRGNPESRPQDNSTTTGLVAGLKRGWSCHNVT